MKRFQEHSIADLERVVRGRVEDLSVETVNCEPFPAAGHEDGDVYLRVRFQACGRSYDVYIYNDEAEVQYAGEDLCFELPDYENNEDKLRAAFIEVIRLSLDGYDSKSALAEARRFCGVAS